MMGRGLVNPLDQQHAANPPSHPELMALLGDEFRAHQFDIKWFLGELAKTETYQRSSVLPDTGDAPPPESFVIANEKRLSGEQIVASVLIATGTQGASPRPPPKHLREPSLTLRPLLSPKMPRTIRNPKSRKNRMSRLVFPCAAFGEGLCQSAGGSRKWNTRRRSRRRPVRLEMIR